MEPQHTAVDSNVTVIHNREYGVIYTLIGRCDQAALKAILQPTLNVMGLNNGSKAVSVEPQP